MLIKVRLKRDPINEFIPHLAMSLNMSNLRSEMKSDENSDDALVSCFVQLKNGEFIASFYLLLLSYFM